MKTIRTLCFVILAAIILLVFISCKEPETRQETGYEKQASTTDTAKTAPPSKLPPRATPPPPQLTEEQKIEEMKKRQQMQQKMEQERPAEYEGKK